MFIVLEGIDIKGNLILSSILSKRIPNSIALKENSSLTLEMIKNPEKAVEIFEKLCEEREKLSNRIREYLRLGKTVILDRYFPSSICCQIEVCKERGFDCKGLVKVYQKYYPRWLKPDLIFILSSDLESCINGIREIGYQADENILKKVKRCYDSLSDLVDNVYYIKDEKDAFSIIRNMKSVKA